MNEKKEVLVIPQAAFCWGIYFKKGGSACILIRPELLVVCGGGVEVVRSE
jgi:hypothetical protein